MYSKETGTGNGRVQITSSAWQIFSKTRSKASAEWTKWALSTIPFQIWGQQWPRLLWWIHLQGCFWLRTSETVPPHDVWQDVLHRIKLEKKKDQLKVLVAYACSSKRAHKFASKEIKNNHVKQYAAWIKARIWHMKVTHLESIVKKNPPVRFCNSKNSVCAYTFAILICLSLEQSKEEHAHIQLVRKLDT